MATIGAALYELCGNIGRIERRLQSKLKAVLAQGLPAIGMVPEQPIAKVLEHRSRDYVGIRGTPKYARCPECENCCPNPLLLRRRKADEGFEQLLLVLVA